MYEVRLSRRAVKDLDALPKKDARRISDRLEKLALDPQSDQIDTKVLVGAKKWKRLRAGDFRAIYRIIENGQILLVARIVNRKQLEQALLSLPD